MSAQHRFEKHVGSTRCWCHTLTVVKHTSVGQQQRDQFGVLVQLHGEFALIGKQSANVNSKIHLVWQAREERQHQFVVVIWWNKVRRQSIALAEIVWVGEREERKGSLSPSVNTSNPQLHTCSGLFQPASSTIVNSLAVTSEVCRRHFSLAAPPPHTHTSPVTSDTLDHGTIKVPLEPRIAPERDPLLLAHYQQILKNVIRLRLGSSVR